MAVVVLLSKSYNIVLYLLFYTVFYNLERGPFFLLFLLKRPIKWLKSKHFPKVLFCVNSLTLKKSSLFCNVGFFFSQIGMCQRKIYGSSKTFHPPLYLSKLRTMQGSRSGIVKTLLLTAPLVLQIQFLHYYHQLCQAASNSDIFRIVSIRNSLNKSMMTYLISKWYLSLSLKK